MFSRIRDKLFPAGIWAFFILELFSWVLEQLFSITFFSYFGYVLIVIYIVFLIAVINEKYKMFSLSLNMQWIIFLFLPIAATLLAISRLKATSTYSKITFVELLIQKDNATYIAAVFFFCALFIWSCFFIIKHYVNRNAYFAYAATCIPIKATSTLSDIKICLIENRSHNESTWMFPGGHVDLSKNYYNAKDTSLSNISVIPEKIVEKKAVEEAGLENLAFISLSDFREDARQLETGWGLNAPAFNYLFKVNDSANCYSILHHRVHLDFTYIATYSSIKDNKYRVYEFNLALDRLPSDKEEAISSISYQLQNAINEFCFPNGQQRKAAHDLFPDSIPEMIYCACKYYKVYLDIHK